MLHYVILRLSGWLTYLAYWNITWQSLTTLTWHYHNYIIG